MGEWQSLITHPNGSLLLVPVFAQSFLPLVRRHLMTLPFFTAWHDRYIYSFVPEKSPDSSRLIKSKTRAEMIVSAA